MRHTATRLVVTTAVIVAATLLLSGCIVCVDDIFCDSRPPRTATLHVYALDYYTGVPIPWAVVEVYERGWWSWNCLGTWHVNQAGYVRVHAGTLSYDGCDGAESERFKIVVYASGYYSERYEIELSYYYPTETLSFYLVPAYARASGEAEGEALGPSTRFGLPGAEDASPDRARGRVVVGEPESARDESR